MYNILNIFQTWLGPFKALIVYKCRGKGSLWPQYPLSDLRQACSSSHQIAETDVVWSKLLVLEIYI